MSVSTEGGWHLDISFEECDELLAAPECKATPASYTADDFEQCSGFLHKGSSSFYAASKLLPEEVRRGTVMLYSFCRLADDLVDELGDPARALVILRRRLDRVYRGVPCDHAVDRGLLCAAETWGIPKAVFDALLEGFQWDSEERKYATIDELIEYCVRVASTVGVMMTLVMGERSLPALARACDLGVAFQLTNIARDVGEDARNGKVYLPESWLVDEGLSSAALMAKPEATEPLKRVVDRMLRVADQVYADAELGVRMLPGNCQSAVQAAHLIYKAIGGVLRDKLLLDSVNSRARTTGFVKIGWALLAVLQTKLIWPVKTALHGDARLELAWTMCEAFPEYTPLLAPFAAEEQRGVVPKPASECTHPANRATAKADKGNLEAALDRLAVWKGVRALPDGSPALGNGSWRTDNLSAPRDQTNKVGKLRYLKEARSYGDLWGLTSALLIICSWATCLCRGLFFFDIGLQLLPAVLLQMLLQTFLYTGMFITAHDAMHGLVTPGWRKLNDVIGALCVGCFALFAYKKLLAAHWEHHMHPGTARDPDFHDGKHTSLLGWYANFMCEYASVIQLAGMGATYNLLAFLVGVPHSNLMLCWVAPALLSSMQLFYFGTYLPHHDKLGPKHVDAHRSRSNNMPPWLSFITCYHFGYHWEHHEYPYVPWWKLPSVRNVVAASEETGTYGVKGKAVAESVKNR